MKCDNCNEKASIFLSEIRHGKQINKALCEQCVIQSEGMPDKTRMPINELLTHFVMAHAGLQKETDNVTKPETGTPPMANSKNGGEDIPI
jgi:protein-arginine kinase activator protein McsA